MDFKEKRDLKNPWESANPLSRLVFWWVVPLFRKGYRSDLSVDDMYNVPEVHKSENVTAKLSTQWHQDCSRAFSKGLRPSFFRSLLKTFGNILILHASAIMFDELIIRISAPIALRLLVQSFKEDSGTSPGMQYLYASIVCLGPLLHVFFLHHCFLLVYRTGMNCRVATSSLIYRKAMKHSKGAENQVAVGQIINLLSNDVSRFDYSVPFIPFLFVGPIQIGILFYLLWAEMGISSLVGVGIVALITPAQFFNGKLSAYFRDKIARRTDERGRIMNEMIGAIRIIKMYAWEKPFSALVARLRRSEMNVISKRVYQHAFFLSVYTSSTKLVPFFTIMTFALLDNDVTADKIFFCLAIFQILNDNMLYYVPSGAAGLGEIFTSCKRIEEFLLMNGDGNSNRDKSNDKASNNRNQKSQNTVPLKMTIAESQNNTACIRMRDVTARWTSDSPFVFDNISLNLEGDQIVIVVGAVGCGKTSLLQLLLSELPMLHGQAEIHGKMTYASQESWIFSGNIRQNIIFGTEFNENLYKSIVQACALKDDFRQLPFGDMSIVGEKGVALSGGQKARVNLARALYQQGDIYLLDDPLSAVDAQVSQHIFDKCIRQFLKGRLRVLVTHQLQYLPRADHIVVLGKKSVLAQGTYEQLVREGIDFVSLMTSETNEENQRKGSVLRPNEVESKYEAVDEPEEPEEKMQGGAVTLRTYWDYFNSSGSISGLVIVTCLFIIVQFLVSSVDYWLSHWTTAEEKCKASNCTGNNGNGDIFDKGSYQGRNSYLFVYLGLVTVFIVMTTLKVCFFFRFCLKIGTKLHNNMFSNLVRAPSKFFDENPSGRLMNRFTKDVGCIDEILPPAFYDSIEYIVQMFGVVALVIMSNVYLAIPAIVVFIGLIIIRRVYVRTGRDIKRVEAIKKSPVFNHVSASLQGMTTIRAFGAHDLVCAQFDLHQNVHSSAWFLFIASTRWFVIWIESFCILFLTIVTFSFVVLSEESSGGVIGLVLTSTLTLVRNLQWGIRQSAETENFMTSVERALEYTKVEPEAPLESSQDKKPWDDWPSAGAIRFNSVSLSYDEKDVLKNLSFEILGREKVGIVGRTGAGKSSIISALFRMTEPRGDIIIDDVRVNNIGLHDLRANMSIIPQDPVLFSGTIRYNLDPLDQFLDEQLWNAIVEVQLKDSIPALDFKVTDGGSNFSVGQRQLICLARAVIRKNRIIVMDEATANVDPKTDRFIQETIRTKFKDCTIITIAHRLHSVMDCDKILVLDNGNLVEYAHPHILLQDPHGSLTALVDHTGKASAAKLRRMAEKAYLA